MTPLKQANHQVDGNGAAGRPEQAAQWRVLDPAPGRLRFLSVAPETNRGGPSLEPKDYLTILRRRWLVIAIVTAIVLGVALYHESRLSKVYEASGAFVVSAGGDGISDAATEAKIAESSAVHAFALKSAPQIGTVETSVDPGDSLVTVTGQSGIPAEAANTVNAHLTAYLDYTRQTQSDRYTAAVGGAAADHPGPPEPDQRRSTPRPRPPRSRGSRARRRSSARTWSTNSRR